ncbi:WD repeat-containing protein 97 isoform X1 [Mauremys reevesii]|uniref:WD repeat-containing protein 97 isoform X1 n=1 Tax=Mauremys reevesii TaxID=260615 RepID=UPI00193FF361|nr:WD repeat-containing protein 97 isoform X1 [Mauremys reevesii]XP_039381377.1 WD repeat-containing protein 97 isoform X1 [Mauremys reevesii]
MLLPAMAEQWESQDSGSAASTGVATNPSTMPHRSSLPEAREETQLTSAHRLWALLRGGIRAATEKMKKEELKPAQLTHGLQHLRHLSFPQPVRHVAYNSSASLLVVLDAESQLHLHKEDGWLSHGTQAPEPIVGLLYATQVNKYVAWDQGSLQVLGPAFEVLSKVLAPHGIRCCCYSPELNQVVTAGAGSLSIWAFRYGFRQLQCQATVQQGLSPRDTFTRLALDTGVPQTCFAACDTGVAAFNISQGELLTFQRDLHNRAITDITYCEAGACVVTASRDTTIKVWDKKWLIQTIFVGHTGPVTAVTIYPQGPLILSASQDGTIRTWNLQTIDQVDEVHVAEVVEQLQTHPEGGYVVSLTGSTMDLWKVNQLYSLHTRLGAAVTRLCTVDLSAVGSFPVRAVCVCQDSTVRLVAAHTGRILSTLLLDRPCQAVEVAYCLPKETLFVLLELGQLLRVNTAVNPMSVKKMVAPWSESARPCCLLLYSHLVDPEKAYAQWQEIVEQKGDKKAWAQLPLKLQDKNRYLLVLGQEDGSLCVLQWFTGRVQCQVEAHGSERVTALAAYPLDTWIISAGGDRTVKVWRIFPYIDECLTLLLSFSCQHPVLHMCPLGSTLGAAIQDPESATYSIVQYDLLAQSCQEHGPEDDPLDEIMGLCCCPTLKLFASASRDGSVKVWNAQNQLLRHLKLNTIPESLAFGNERGDLLLGVEQHLHRIHHSKYLPRPYLTKLLCMSLPDPVQDSPFPLSDSSLRPLSKDARRRLLLEPRSLSAKLCVPLLRWKPKKDEDLSWARREKEEACAQLAARDQDLLLIQQGKLSTARKPKLNKKLQDEAFERYMHLIYRQPPKIQIPHNDSFDADMVLEACLLGPLVPNLYGPAASHMFLGAFPDGAEENAERPMLEAPVADGVCREDALEPRAGRGSCLALPTPSASKGLEDSLRRASLARIRSQISQAPVADGVCREDALEPRAGRGSRLARPTPSASKGLEDSLRRASLARIRSQISQEAPGTGHCTCWARWTIGLTWCEEVGMFWMCCAPVADGVCREDALEPRAGRGSRLALPAPSASKGLEDSLRRSSLARIRSQISQARQEAAAASEIHHPGSWSRSPSLQITRVNGHGPSMSQVSSQMSKGSSHLHVRRLSSGFLPNSVVVQQFRSQDDIESARESLLATWLEVQQGQAGRAGPEHGEELPGVEEEEAILEKISSLSLPGPKWKEESLASGPESAGASRAQPVPLCAPVTEPASPEPAWTSSVTSFFLTQPDEFEQPQASPSGGEIPSFVLQFEDTEWFRQIYPVLSSMDSLQGLSMSRFVRQLLEALLTVDDGAKADIVQAILTLHEQVGVENGREVCKALLLILNQSDPPKLEEKTQKKFVLTSLNALMAFCRDSKELLLELMAYFLHSPVSSRGSIKALFIELGLEDPHNYFYQEMDSWDLARETPVTKAALRRICAQWLEGVMQDFQDHKSSTLEPFQARAGKRHFPGSSPKAKKAAGRSKVFPSAGSPEPPVGPINAINHFCKVQMKRDLEDLKQPKSAGAQETKNTVMALPSIGRSQAILRLGETNTMARRRPPQRFYLPRIFPLPLLTGFVHAIKLPVPRINVNPFPPDSDMPSSQNTFISMHQKVQKYFIPKFSLADSYP